MRKTLFALLLALLCPQLMPAQQTYTARVIDAETGEPLPCVSIYVSEGRGTLTNDEGDFTLKMEPEEVMHIRCVGYYSQTLKAASLTSPIRLKPLTIDLREVTVRPTDDNKLLSKVVDRLRKDYKKAKKRSRRYFSRSVVVNKDSTNAEMLEAIMDIGSAVNLHNFMMLNGKLSQDQADEWEEMDNHGYRKNVDLAQSGSRVPFKMDIMLSAEVGYEWVMKETWRLRLAAYADYGLVNINPKGNDYAAFVPAATKFDFATYQLHPSFGSRETSSAGVHNLFVGLKFTILYTLYQPDKCILCSHTRRSKHWH